MLDSPAPEVTATSSTGAAGPADAPDVADTPDAADTVEETLHALCRPSALLLDFGGVIVSTSKRPEGRRAFAQQLSSRLARTGVEVSAQRLESCLQAGATSLKHWKHASSRRSLPRELSVQEILGDFYFGDLEDPARAVLTGWGTELLDEMATALTDHTLRDGARELIEFAREHSLPLGIVSNAHSGRSHRRILAELGLAEAFGVQIYSDEAGIRKPHPQMLCRAAEALGADLAESWYVGDTLDRDVVAGRRAGVGAVILTRSQHTDEPPFPVESQPEAVLETPAELLELLRRRLASAPGPDDRAATPAASLHPAASVPAQLAAGTVSGMQNRAILLDHGGVVSAPRKQAEPFREAAETVEAVLARSGSAVEPGMGRHIVEVAHEEYKKYKAAQDESELYGEVTPRMYWGEFTASTVTARQRQALVAAAEVLHPALYRSKSSKTERPGIRSMLLHAVETGRRVVIVSNTICGTGVRGIIRSYGLDGHIAGWVCSDEIGLKKPHPEIFLRALAMAGVAPEHAVMVGDKPFNDAYGAQRAGIGRRILTRGGSGEESELQEALTAGWATDLVTDPGEIPALLH